MSTAASFPDHYQTLGIAPSADEEAIRKAYRAQARKYHPDAAPDNPFAPAQFRALKEAYEVLSTPQQRRRYDEERWLRGMTRTRNREISSATLLEDAQKVEAHLKKIGRSTVMPCALQQLLLYLLREEHLAVLSTEGKGEINEAFAEAILHAVGYLPLNLTVPVLERLYLITPLSSAFEERLSTEISSLQRRQKHERLLPWIVVLVTVLLCLLMAIVFRR